MGLVPKNREFKLKVLQALYMQLLIAIHQPVLLMELAQGAVGFHLGNDGVDKGEQIVLTFAHQHTNFSMGEGSV